MGNAFSGRSGHIAYRVGRSSEEERNRGKNGDRLVAARTTTDGIKSNTFLPSSMPEFQIPTINQLAMRSFHTSRCDTLYIFDQVLCTRCIQCLRSVIFSAEDRRITFHHVQRIQ